MVDTAYSDIVYGGDDIDDIPGDEDSMFDWTKFDPGPGLSAWDKLGEGYEQDAALVGAFLAIVHRL